MNTELTITTERIDDFAVDQDDDASGTASGPGSTYSAPLAAEGLSWGWVATIWLAHIMSQGDHRKLKVWDWVRQAHTTLEETTGMASGCSRSASNNL